MYYTRMTRDISTYTKQEAEDFISFRANATRLRFLMTVRANDFRMSLSNTYEKTNTQLPLNLLEVQGNHVFDRLWRRDSDAAA